MSSMYPSFGGAAARPCIRCGAPLALNVSQCSRCGMLNPLPQGQQPGTFQQGQPARSLGPSWGMQPPQSPPFPQNGGGVQPDNAGSSSWGPPMGQAGGWPQNTLFPGQKQPPSQPLQQNLFGNNGNNFAGQSQAFGNNGNNFPGQSQAFGNSGFSQPSQSSLNSAFANYQQNQNAHNNFFVATQQRNYGTSPLVPMDGLARRGYQPDNDENEGKKRPNAAVVSLIVILLIALVGGGAAFAGYKFLRQGPNTVNSTPTPVVISTPTGTPLFSDPFTGTGSNWDTTAHPGTKLTIANGKMVMESDTRPLLLPVLLLNKTFADFRVDVDVALAKGDAANGYGMYIRASSTQDTPLGLYYRFEVYGDGSFWIYKGTADGNGNSISTALKQSAPNNAVYTNGNLNHLTVIAKGSQLSFIINSTTVSTFTDTTYKSGAVALFVSNIKGSTTNALATFEHFAVFQAQ
jgi:3-keto-disaccharide hydrolase